VKKKQINHRYKSSDGHPNHTDTAGPAVQSGEHLRHAIQDAGDMRDHPSRDLPAPAGGDMWGAQLNAPAPQVGNGMPIMAQH
jgi:hypothetical protein